jgi:hypothetical protein
MYIKKKNKSEVEKEKDRILKKNEIEILGRYLRVRYSKS